jgi:carbonic anhydrase
MSKPRASVVFDLKWCSKADPTFLVCGLLLVSSLRWAQNAAAPVPTNPPPTIPVDAALSPDEALHKLMAGNERFVHDTPQRPNQAPTRRTQLDFDQHPFACILACSDSRVPPELVFDQGLGDLFVVRMAGNVLDETGLGSLELAVERLQSPLIVVLGHTRCGAVSAAVSGQSTRGHIGEVISALKPAVRAAHDQPGDPVEQAIKENIQLTVARLKSSKPILAEYVKTGRLKVVGARYDLATGTVELLP